MKYGYRDTEWRDNSIYTRFTSAVIGFNINGFQAFMKRKTVYKDEEQMVYALKEMVEMMEEHLKEMRRV
jgi:hypothetical protein